MSTQHEGAIPLIRERTDLVHLFASTLEPLTGEAQRLDAELAFEHPGVATCEARVDPEKIAWIVAVLAGNALRYVRRGTRLHAGGTVTVRLARQDGSAILTVQDDGQGIPAVRLARLFERSGGAPHALGLSLGLARAVALAHGGTLDVESSTDEADHGTTVRVTLPLA